MHVLVTGASRGLGLEVVRSLLNAGDRVTATSRIESEALAELRVEHPESLRYFACDLTGECDRVLATFESHLQPGSAIDGFVNNAAVAYDDLVTNARYEDLDRMFHVNATLPIMLTRFVLRRMLLHSTKGSLVHVSSISAQRGYKGLAMYAASKAALEGFSIGVAREWGSLGIRSNCVVPGFMETDMSAGIAEEERNRIYRRTALGQATDSTSVAATIRFLLSPESRSITGECVRVDCGT